MKENLSLNTSSSIEFIEKNQSRIQIPQQDQKKLIKDPQQNPIQSCDKTLKTKHAYKLSLKTHAESSSPYKQSRLKLKKCKYSSDNQNPQQLSGHWNTTENKKYHWFLEINFSNFIDRSLRRTDKIFTSMAKFVGTREAEQCRSHHQKMQKKYKTFCKILLNLRMEHYSQKSSQSVQEQMENNKITLLKSLLSETALNIERILMSSLTSQKSESPFLNEHQKSQGCQNISDDFKLDFEELKQNPFQQNNYLKNEEEVHLQPQEPILSHIDMWLSEFENGQSDICKHEQKQFNEKGIADIFGDDTYERKLDFGIMMFDEPPNPQ